VTGNRAQRARRIRVGNNGRLLGTAGWEFVHVCIDDATRLAYVEVLGDEKVTTAIAFLRRAVQHFAGYGITTERLITDNGSAYRSTIHAIALPRPGDPTPPHRPYRPQTNGKAERFIRTMLRGWAYGAVYRDSAERNAALAGWLDFHNHRRPHGALAHKPTIARLQRAEQPARVLQLANQVGRRAGDVPPARRSTMGEQCDCSGLARGDAYSASAARCLGRRAWQLSHRPAVDRESRDTVDL
jgi:transposase InsO family protein